MVVEQVQEWVRGARALREWYLRDAHRPRYHFVAPEGVCIPFDPNGALYWKGRYHLFYIFQDPALPHGGHCWGHASSVDLVHWTLHPTALAPAPGDPEVGIFSGDAFVNREGVPTILYHGVGAGTCVATSEDDELVHWHKWAANPVIPEPKEGEPGYGVYNVFDPCVWIDGDTYYTALGGQVLPEKRFDTAYVFRSRDLVHWTYAHPLYEPNPAWTVAEEDCACPDFFALGDKHVLLCISHYVGARYYVGRYEEGRFYPERHVRMNWPGGAYFAPESLLDERGRRIVWAWVCEQRDREAQQASGWAGVMSLPRVLSAGDGGAVWIDPVEELAGLRLHERVYREVALADGVARSWREVRGACLELAIEVDPGEAQEVEVRVCCSPDGAEQTSIVYRPAEQRLAVDARRSSLSEDVLQLAPRPYATFREEAREEGEDVRVQEAPLVLEPGEPLRLRVFVDRSIVEVFANRRQCVTQRIYPTREDSVGVVVVSRGGGARVRELRVWEMAAE